MNHHGSGMPAQAERRAEYRALAINPGYQPLREWICPICSGSSPRSSTRCDTCGSMGPEYLPPVPPERPRTPVIVRVGRGQAIVEFALILPVALFTALGFLEAGFLIATQATQDRSTAVVVDWAADHPSEDWRPLAEAELPGCDVSVEPDASFPDVLRAVATCTYVPRVTSNLWHGLPISSSESAEMSPSPTFWPQPVAVTISATLGTPSGSR